MSAARWAKAGLVALVVAAWPTYALFNDRIDSGAGRPDSGAEVARLDFTLKDMNGKDVRLTDFKGRPLIVNFWATWCGPCKHEIPVFVELVDKYRDEKLTVLGISTDDSAEDLRPFAAAYKMSYPVLVGLGHDELLEAYGASYAIPVSWFVKRDGTVSAKLVGTQSREWFERQVKALF